MENKAAYPTEGARILAETGKTRSQLVFEEYDIPDEDVAVVGLYANFLLNTSPGERPSGAMRRACERYKRGGRAAVIVVR